MRPFIKSISPEDPVVKPIMDAFGWEGYGRFIAVLDFCRTFQIGTLDIQLIVNQTRSNRRGAAKLLPIFQQCLTKVLEQFGESFPKVLENNGQSLENVSPKFDESLPKLDAQNPHGSISSINNLNNTETDTCEENTHTTARVFDEKISVWVDKAHQYLIEKKISGLKIESAIEQTKDQIRLKFQEMIASTPFKPDELLECWMAAVDAGEKNKVSTLDWIYKSFTGKVSIFTPGAGKIRVAAQDNRPRHQKILEADCVVYMEDQSEYKGSDLEYLPDAEGGAHFRVKESGRMLLATWTGVRRFNHA